MFINAGARLLCTSARGLSGGLCLVLVCRGRHGLGGGALLFILGSNLGGCRLQCDDWHLHPFGFGLVTPQTTCTAVCMSFSRFRCKAERIFRLPLRVSDANTSKVSDGIRVRIKLTNRYTFQQGKCNLLGRVRLHVRLFRGPITNGMKKVGWS